MQRTTRGPWVHITCARFIPEVTITFKTASRIDPEISTAEVPARRSGVTCTICKITQGACVTCHHAACSTAFHVTCALHQRYKHSLGADASAPGADDAVQPHIYCRLHS